MTLNDIKSSHWQLSLGEIGNVAEGVDDVNQCILVILLTVKGSDPLRPNFGCGLTELVDRPINQAVPQMVKNMLEAIELWEKRIVVKKITHQILPEQIKFNIHWQFSVGFVSGDFDVSVGLFDKKIQSSIYSPPISLNGFVLAAESGNAISAENGNIISV